MRIAPQDRDVLKAFGAAGETLFFFKSRHTYYLANTDLMEGASGELLLVPDVRLADDSTGAASQNGVVSAENALYFFSGEGKVYKVPSSSGGIAEEKSPFLRDILGRVFKARMTDIEGGYAELDRKILFALSLDQSPHNNAALMMDMTNESWTLLPTPIESMAELRDSDGQGKLCFGNIRGDVCQFGVGDAFGARSGSISGKVTGATINTLQDDLASFHDIAGLPVSLFSADWELVQTNMVSSRDAQDEITLLWPWEQIPDTGTWYYLIGAMLPLWKFGWMEVGDWGTLHSVRLQFRPTYGTAGLYIAIDDGEDELVSTINLGGEGHHDAWVMLGGDRFRTSIRSFEGSGPLQLNSIIWDIEVTPGSI